MRRFAGFRRIAALLLGLALLCGSFAACSSLPDLTSAVAAGEFPVDVNGVTIAARPQKVLVLSPSLADVVLALGCDTQLAASSEACTQDQLRDLPKLSEATPEALQSAGVSPDLVLLDPASASTEEALRDAGLTVLNIAPAADRSGYERLFAQVSSALSGGGPGYDAGIAAAQDIFLTLDEITRVVPSDTVVTACYLYDLGGSAVTGDMLGSTIMTYSGVTNIFKDVVGGQYDYDTLRMANPNLIFCAPGLKEELESDSRFSNLVAVRGGKVFELEPRLMERQGRTIVECALEISAAAFPELTEASSQTTDPASKIEDQVSSALTSSALEADETEYEPLKEGDQGDGVLAMQTRLDELGYLDTDYDGHYGEYTASCVKDFQRANGLPETGEADETTQKLLFSNRARRAGEAAASPAPSPSVSPESSEEGGEEEES